MAPRRTAILLCLLGTAAGLASIALAAPAAFEAEPVLWPERQRAFLQDGPGLLLDAFEKERFLAMDEAGREAFIQGFLADPLPETPDNELVEAIRRRRLLARNEILSPFDDRARLLFLHGRPRARAVVDCGLVFQPIEVWAYPERAPLLLYRPGPGRPFRLWTLLDSKAALYTEEVAYYLREAGEERRQITGPRLDRRLCPQASLVDQATGISGLSPAAGDAPAPITILRLLGPPADLAAWAAAASATPLPAPSPEILTEPVLSSFPAWRGQRVITRLLIPLPAVNGAVAAGEEGEPRYDLVLDGVLEQAGETFEEIRVRFQPTPPPDGKRLALVVERALRPGHVFLARFRIRDAIAGGEAIVTHGFRVPPAEEDTPPPADLALALGEELARQRIRGEDDLLLVPPVDDVILGLWRAEVIVTGERIERVRFLVDGEAQLTRNRRPFSAEVRLADLPREQLVRAEGYDIADNLVAADEVLINQPRGAFRVRIVEPPAGFRGAGELAVEAEVVIPEERHLEAVEFRLDDRLVARREGPPWTARVEVPAAGEMAFLTVTAILDDGRKAEEVRILNAPRFLEAVDVTLVELYTAVVDRHGALVRGLRREDFEVLEDGRTEEIVQFHEVQDLPLTVGIVLDTSTSMAGALGEAKIAARAFLGAVLEPGDRCFVVGFANEPEILIPPTGDAAACAESLADTQAVGSTALNDAMVTGLYYFRAFKGQKAMVVLSDGEDTASHRGFDTVREFARRSGIAIYPVGLAIGPLDVAARRRLSTIAEETGGRAFFISAAAELAGVYAEIEEELRTRYLLAYASDRPAAEPGFRSVEVRVAGGRLKARTIRGYYP